MYIPSSTSPSTLPPAQVPIKKDITEKELRQALTRAGIELENADNLDGFIKLLNWYRFEIAKDSPDATLPFTNQMAPGQFFGLNNFGNPVELEEKMRSRLASAGVTEWKLPRLLNYGSFEKPNEAARNSLKRCDWSASLSEIARHHTLREQTTASLKIAEKKALASKKEKLYSSYAREGKLTPVKGAWLDEQSIGFLLKNHEIQPMVERIRKEMGELDVKSCWEGKTPCNTLFRIINFTEITIAFDKDRQLIVNGYKCAIKFTTDNCQLVAYQTSNNDLHILSRDIGKEEGEPIHLRRHSTLGLWVPKHKDP